MGACFHKAGRLPIGRASRSSSLQRGRPALQRHRTRCSEPGAGRNPERASFARRNVVVAVGAGPIALVEDVLDIELRAPGLVDLGEQAGIDADKTGQSDGVVRRSERVREVDDAERGGPTRIDLIFVPERELIIGHQLDAVAGNDRGRGVAGDARIRVGIAECGLPIRHGIAGHGGLDAADFIRPAREEQAVAAGIGDRHIGAVELIHRRGELQFRQDIPLRADLGVLELLRRQQKRARRQGRELVARSGQIGDAVSRVDRQVLDRLEDHGRARRNLLVGSVALDVGVQVRRRQIKAVIARAENELQPARRFDLVLHIAGCEVQPIFAVGIGCQMVEDNRPEIGRIERVDGIESLVSVVRKHAGVAPRQARLPSELGAERDRVQHRTGRRLVGEVGLVEGVLARRVVLIGVERDLALVGRDGAAACSAAGAAGIDVAIAAVVVGVERGILHRQPVAEIMLDHGGAGLQLDLGAVVARIAEEFRQVAIRRERHGRIEPGRAETGKPDRWIAAIGEPEVVVEFVGQLDLGVVIRLQGHGRVEAIALELAEIAKGVAAFVESVQPDGDIVVDGLAGIEREPAVVVGAGLRGRFIDALAIGFLQGPVDEAAAGAAAEHQRTRALQHLDALRVIEIAEILHVVAKAVDVEIGAGIDAADHQLVAIAFALMHRDPGHIACHVGQALKVLVADILLGEHGDGLRDVDQLGVGLGRARRAVTVDPDGAGSCVLG